jgi:hypothetical protein
MFGFVMGHLQHLDLSSKTLSFHQRACRVVWLTQRLPNFFARIYMDSLFNSVKLYHTLYRAEALAHGVVWLNRHGIPTAIIQKEEKHRDCAEKLQGSTHAARLANVPGCPNMLAVSTYDTKAVHILILSTVAVLNLRTSIVFDVKVIYHL